MKICDSDMPDEAFWESLFDIPLILEPLAIGQYHDVAELGCGYGTFTVPSQRPSAGCVTLSMSNLTCSLHSPTGRWIAIYL